MKTINLVQTFLSGLILLTCIELLAQQEGCQNIFIDDFRYGLFVPPDYNPEVPHHLLLYLHGYSDTTSWDFQWYSPSWQEQYPTIVITPKCPIDHQDGWGNSWEMIESWGMGMTFRAIDSTLKYYNIDTTRMHIGGTSMGSFGTFYVLASHPGMFASAWATCGGGDPETANLLKDTPLWIFHGSADQTVTVQYSRDMYNALLAAGGQVVRYTEYPGVGHNSWDNVGEETTLDPWLFAQQLGTEHGYPESVANFLAILNDNNYPELSWTAPDDQSTEDKYIWAYRIYKNGELYKTLNNNILTYTDENTEPDSEYTYSVAAMNYFFHETPLSEEITINTEPGLPINNIVSDSYVLKIYPNPVINTLNLNLRMKSRSDIKLSIVNSAGQEISTLINQIVDKGDYSFRWNINHLPEGVYLVVLKTTNKIKAIPVLVKK